MRRAARLAALGIVAVITALAATARGGDDGRTVALVVDRSAALRWADPRGDARAVVALGLALAARSGDKVLVLAPGKEDASAAAGDAGAVARALASLAEEPLAAGGCDLEPSVARALERRGENGALVLFTADEVDVVDARGRAPQALLERARAAGPRPDRAAVNGVARDALCTTLGAAANVVAVRAPLPEPARAMPFLEKARARVLEAGEHPLEAARELALALGAKVAAPVAEVAVADKKARIDVAAGLRVVLLADAPIEVKGGVALDAKRRAWVADARGPLDVVGPDGARVAFASAVVRAAAIEARALRAGGRVAVRARGDGALFALADGRETKLEPGPDGAAHGVIETKAERLRVVARSGETELGAQDVAVAAARLEVSRGETLPPIAGAPVKLEARGPDGLPAGLVPDRIALALRSDKGEAARAELAREGDAWRGAFTPAGAGAFSLIGVEPAGLEAALQEGTLAVGAAPVLQAALVAPDDVRMDDGRATVELELSLVPPAKADVVVQLSGTAGEAQLRSGAALDGKGRATVALHVPALAGRTPARLAVQATHGRGLARASVDVVLVPLFPWKRALAAGLVGAALLWGAVVFVKRRRVAKVFAMRQVRGLGSNGKISYERHLLRAHRASDSTAIAPEGPTAVEFAVGRDGKVAAKALEGSKLVRLDAQQKAATELDLEHGTAFAVVRGLYNKRYVYLDREPNGDELVKRFVPDTKSYDGQQSKDSDVFVLLDEDQNMAPPSQRLVPIDSTRLPNVGEIIQAPSDESVIIADSSEEAILDSQDPDAVLDPGSSDVTDSSDLTTGSSSDETDAPEGEG